MLDEKGKLYILSGPSGSGKSTVIREVLKARDKLYFSVSATTRPKREGEVDGKNYHFVSEERFLHLIQNDALLEYTRYVGNYYGTPAEPILENMEKGFDVLLDIEVCGALAVKKKIPEAVAIFHIPPSLEELNKRLRGRGTDSEESIQQRLKTAKLEYEQAGFYDYIVINDQVDSAVNEVLSIMTAEKCRERRKRFGTARL